MIFMDRYDAGQQLAEMLVAYRGKTDAVVLGLPRGGVAVAAEVAKALNLPLDVICSRKMGAPYNEELAIGAVTDTGHCYFNGQIVDYLDIPEEYIAHIREREQQRALRQLLLFRRGRPRRVLVGKVVILVDDGLATGATMKAAAAAAKAEGAKRVVVAVPVGAVESLEEIRGLVDEVVCVMEPPHLRAIGQFYRDFSQVEDEEVLALLNYPLKP